MSHMNWWFWPALVVTFVVGALYLRLRARHHHRLGMTASHGSVVVGRDNSGIVVTHAGSPGPGRALEMTMLVVSLGSLVVAVLAWLWPQS